MKPEPLKGKERKCYEEYSKCFSKEDIRSAVEWLKQRMESGECHVPECNCFHRDEDYWIRWRDILEAFEDVMKNEGK